MSQCHKCGEHRSRCICELERLKERTAEDGILLESQGRIINNLQDSMKAWREMYYSLLGLVRNEVRTTNSAEARLNNIADTVEVSVLKSRELASRLPDEVPESPSD